VTRVRLAHDGGPLDRQHIGGVSHMHEWTTNFVANTSTGAKLYETTQWDEPVAQCQAYGPNN
jgi:hypothetical protein